MVAGGRRAVLASAITLSACAQLLSLEQYQSGDSSTTTPTASTGAAAGNGNGGSSGHESGGAGLGAGGAIDCTGRLPDQCSMPAPPRGGTCPTDCGGCPANECVKTCDSANPCTNETFVCPAGFACEVFCNSEGCEGLTVVCPEDHDCRVNCNWSDSCSGLNVVCSPSGPCELWCQANEQSCSTVDMMCGCNSCHVNCETGLDITGYEPTVMCGQSCENCGICETQ